MRSMSNDSLSTGNETAQLAMNGGDGFSGDDEPSLITILRVITRRKVLILSTAAVIFCAVAFSTFSKQPVYESVARLRIDPDKSSTLGLDEMLDNKLGTGDSSNRLKT